jgi:hypothetical protein
MQSGDSSTGRHRKKRRRGVGSERPEATPRDASGVRGSRRRAEKNGAADATRRPATPPNDRERTDRNAAFSD